MKTALNTDRSRCAFMYPSKRRCSNTARVWGCCFTHAEAGTYRRAKGGES